MAVRKVSNSVWPYVKGTNGALWHLLGAPCINHLTYLLTYLKTTQLSAHAQNHASPERCRKSFTMIFLSDHDIPLTSSNFGNLTAFRAIFIDIFTAHAV